METTRVRIDENHTLDIYDGVRLEEQPQEAQDVFNSYVDENGILLWWGKNADEFDELNRPSHWTFEWGELKAIGTRTYRYSGQKGRRNWSAMTEIVTLYANIKEE